MSIKSFLIKVRKIPDDLYNKAILYYRKVKVGKNVNINGRIYCVASEKNSIVLGNNVTINSSLKSNPIGGDVKTILYAGKGAKIQIGNNTGISNCAICAKESISIGENVLIGGGK